jgi:hypothetical protein
MEKADINRNASDIKGDPNLEKHSLFTRVRKKLQKDTK